MAPASTVPSHKDIIIPIAIVLLAILGAVGACLRRAKISNAVSPDPESAFVPSPPLPTPSLVSFDLTSPHLIAAPKLAHIKQAKRRVEPKLRCSVSKIELLLPEIKITPPSDDVVIDELLPSSVFHDDESVDFKTLLASGSSRIFQDTIDNILSFPSLNVSVFRSGPIVLTQAQITEVPPPIAVDIVVPKAADTSEKPRTRRTLHSILNFPLPPRAPHPSITVGKENPFTTIPTSKDEPEYISVSVSVFV